MQPLPEAGSARLHIVRHQRNDLVPDRLYQGRCLFREPLLEFAPRLFGNFQRRPVLWVQPRPLACTHLLLEWLLDRLERFLDRLQPGLVLLQESLVCRNLVVARNQHVLELRRGEERLELVVLALADGVELVVVAPRALHCEAEQGLADT